MSLNGDVRKQSNVYIFILVRLFVSHNQLEINLCIIIFYSGVIVTNLYHPKTFICKYYKYS